MIPERIAAFRSRVVYLTDLGMLGTAEAFSECLDEIERLQAELKEARAVARMIYGGYASMPYTGKEVGEKYPWLKES